MWYYFYRGCSCPGKNADRHTAVEGMRRKRSKTQSIRYFSSGLNNKIIITSYCGLSASERNRGEIWTSLGSSIISFIVFSSDIAKTIVMLKTGWWRQGILYGTEGPDLERDCFRSLAVRKRKIPRLGNSSSSRTTKIRVYTKNLVDQTKFIHFGVLGFWSDCQTSRNSKHERWQDIGIFPLSPTSGWEVLRFTRLLNRLRK